MTNIRLTTPQGLTPREWEAWSTLQLADPTLVSPYFRPEFTQAVAAVRSDVEVAILSDENEPIGFFPFQRSRLNLGKPVGGKLSDYHGLIGSWGNLTDAAELMRACGLAGWDFDHLPTSQTPFQPYAQSTAPSRWMNLAQGYEAYVAERRAAGTEAIKKAGQSMRKLAREKGELRLEADTTSTHVFQQLLAWKSEQYRRTGLADLFSYPWIRQLLEHLQAHPRPYFSTELSALWCGDRLIAAMLSLRSRHMLHAWFPAYDPEFQQYAPGLTLFLKLAETCADRGFTVIDLGKGDERYKLSITTPGPSLAEGCLERASLAVFVRKGWRTTRDLWTTAVGKRTATNAAGWLQPVRNWLAHS